MKLYFAPLEGITTNVYRNLHNKMFGGCDKYFSPFIAPSDSERLSVRSVRDILPETNEVPLEVQCLVNSNIAFSNFMKKAKSLGYESVNINFGCPSGTAVSKGKGAGALKDLDKLEKFLSTAFENPPCEISIKTRVGFYEYGEFEEILEIYNKYPISELIVHPRVRQDFYKGEPDFKSFDLAYKSFDVKKLCYNGNISSCINFFEIKEKYPDINSVMIGRGAVKNPAIFREINGGKPASTAELVRFSNELEKRYIKLYQTEMNALWKLKEIWLYQIENYPSEKKIAKIIKKTSRLGEFNNAINCLPEIR